MKSLYNVYQNVLIMMEKYRELTLESPKLSYQQFAEGMNFNRYVIITANCDSKNIRGAISNNTVIIDKDSDYANKSHNFKALFEKIALKPNVINNICVISEFELTSYIDKYVAVARKENPSIYFESYQYKIFKIELYKQISVPQHRIVTADAEKLFYQYFTSKFNIPCINNTDASAAWIGARPNMIIEEQRVSETAAYTTSYLLCITGKLRKEEEEGDL